MSERTMRVIEIRPRDDGRFDLVGVDDSDGTEHTLYGCEITGEQFVSLAQSLGPLKSEDEKQRKAK